METILEADIVGRIKAFGSILWIMIVGLIEWIIPGSWYAKDVSEDIVLITGAGSGLGRQIALEYAVLGCSLILWDINEGGLVETKLMIENKHQDETKEKKSFCLTYLVDVSKRKEVYEAAERVLKDINVDRKKDEPERYVSVLVNNAGIYYGLLLQDLKDEQIERIFNINILAHFWTVRAFLPQMMKYEKGHIVEIASMGGISGLLKQVDYCATKFANVGFEEALNIELDYLGYSDKIFTTVVCPLFFNSNLFTGFDTKIGRLMSPDFVAREAVMAMRCNQSRILLPKLKAYTFWVLRAYMPRKAIIKLTKTLGFAESIKHIKGKAASL